MVTTGISNVIELLSGVALFLFGMTLIDGDNLVPPIMDYMADAVHPNDLGFGVYAANVLRAMNQ